MKEPFAITNQLFEPVPEDQKIVIPEVKVGQALVLRPETLHAITNNQSDTQTRWMAVFFINFRKDGEISCLFDPKTGQYK